ncbi:MAG: hypothetical protein IKK11_03325 [Oscillospiraceae bacterium]|nr:hypothetical protein [Oscillospiraceae bacterium]
MKSMFIRAGSLVMACVVFFFAFLALIPVNVNAAPVEYTVCGVWKLNESLSFLDTYFTESVNFSCLVPFSGVDSPDGFRETTFSFFSFGFRPSDFLDVVFFHGDNSSYYAYFNNTWKDRFSREVDFGSSDQVVSEEFYNWLTANATFQNTPPAPGPLVEVIQDLKNQNLLTQVLAGVTQVIPVILVCLIGFVEFRKAYQALLTLLEQR